MAVALAQSVVKTLSTGSPVSVTMTSTPTSGNVLVAIMRGTYGTTSGGGVTTWQALTAGATLRILWGIVDTTPSATITFFGGRSDSGCFQAAEFSGVTYAASGVAPTSWSTGTSTAPSSGNISPSVRSLLIGGIDASSAVWSSGLSGWTEFGEITGQGGSILRPAWRVADAGTYAASGTLGSSVAWGAAVLALAETAGGSASGGIRGKAGVGVACDVGFRWRR